MERDVCDRDNLIASARVEVEAMQRDRDWFLRVGVVRIMDKLIEYPEFTDAMIRIRHARLLPERSLVVAV